MNTKIGIVLAFIFTLFIVSPAIISLVEKNFDISILLDVNEEENNQKEISKTFDLKLPEQKNCLFTFSTLEKSNLFNYYHKNYTNISQENSSPPPEFP